MVHVDVVGPVRVVAHHDATSAGVLVGLFHGVCVPVGPEEPVLEQRQGEHVGQRARQRPVAVLAVHVGEAVRRINRVESTFSQTDPPHTLQPGSQESNFLWGHNKR